MRKNKIMRIHKLLKTQTNARIKEKLTQTNAKRAKRGFAGRFYIKSSPRFRYPKAISPSTDPSVIRAVKASIPHT